MTVHHNGSDSEPPLPPNIPQGLHNELIIPSLAIKIIFMNICRIKMQIHCNSHSTLPRLTSNHPPTHSPIATNESRGRLTNHSRYCITTTVLLCGCWWSMPMVNGSDGNWRIGQQEGSSVHTGLARVKVVCANLWCVNTMTRILSIPTRADSVFSDEWRRRPNNQTNLLTYQPATSGVQTNAPMVEGKKWNMPSQRAFLCAPASPAPPPPLHSLNNINGNMPKSGAVSDLPVALLQLLNKQWMHVSSCKYEWGSVPVHPGLWRRHPVCNIVTQS